RARVLVYQSRDFNEAERCFREYLQQRPDDVTASMELARVLWNRHRREEAFQVAWAAFDRDSDKLPSHSIGFVGQVALRILPRGAQRTDRKSTRLNSSHVKISYA